jgi:hypothetical protein
LVSVRNLTASGRAIAIIGVLLHAGLVAWHSVSMLQSTQQRDALAAALAVICIGGGVADAQADGRVPPFHGSDQAEREACKCCLSAVAMLRPPLLTFRLHAAISSRIEITGEIIARRLAGVRPPPRGPPLNA